MKNVVVFFEILITILLLAIPVLAQTCADTLMMPDTTISNKRSFKIPVILTNSCPVGGFNMVISTSAPDIVKPASRDTMPPINCQNIVGTRLWNYVDTVTYYDSLGQSHTRIDTVPPWEFFYSAPGAVYPESLFAVGVANYFSGPGDTLYTHPPLKVGSGKIFWIKFDVPCSYMPAATKDTSIELQIAQAFITDSTGHNHQVTYYNGQVNLHMGTPFRGDANCNGIRMGSDVTYLVAFFKGQAGCPCTVPAADANGDGLIRGSDVTFLVRYFKGIGPEPPQ